MKKKRIVLVSIVAMLIFAGTASVFAKIAKDPASNMFDPGRYPDPCSYGGISVCYGN